MQQGTAHAAQQTAQTAREQAGSVAGTAKDQARNVAQDAKEQARSVAQQVQEDMKQRASTEASRFAETLRSTGGQLRQMAESGGEQQGFAQSLAREAAQAADKFADRLDTGGVEGVLAEFRSFARRNPGTFLFGAAAVGFVAGRIVRNLSGDGEGGGDIDLDRRGVYGSYPYGTDTSEAMLGDPETEIATGLYGGTPPAPEYTP